MFGFSIDGNKNTYENIKFNVNGLKEAEGERIVWDFGDGNTAVGTSSSHSFDTMGDHNVTMYLLDVNEGEERIKSCTSQQLLVKTMVHKMYRTE